jgi:hypothetical protein
MNENFWGGSKKPFPKGYGHRHALILAFFLRVKTKIYKFLRGYVRRHFDIFFLGVQILLSSSIGRGGGIFFGMAPRLRTTYDNVGEL